MGTGTWRTGTWRTKDGTAQSWTYTYNDTNQRTQATLADGSYWAYGYDQLGQVTSGVKHAAGGAVLKGEDFGYAFDTIGNRISATANGQASEYDVNLLNQYTERTVPGVVDIIGEATENKLVLVNGEPADRQGQHFHLQLEVDNAAAPVYPEITAIVGQKGTPPAPDVYLAETNGNRFVAKTPEQFMYDADGNLPALRSLGEGGTTDGRWTNVWDGENRLLSMETLASVVSAGIPRERLEFAYDSQCRRVRKTALSGFTNGTFSITNTTAYLYDGWNLVTEVSTNLQLAIGNRQSYLWGLDLSQSLQGAGGVGGLLSCSSLQSPASSLLYCYDGNGNVMALVDTADGSLAATYEYDPFGNTLRATGEHAAANPFRFSTKYTDDETGLVYYGYRYYSAELGRWVSRDPAGEQDSPNVQLQCRNSCIDSIDPLGLLTFMAQDEFLTRSDLGSKSIRCGVLTLKHVFIDADLSDTLASHDPQLFDDIWKVVPDPIKLALVKHKLPGFLGAGFLMTFEQKEGGCCCEHVRWRQTQKHGKKWKPDQTFNSSYDYVDFPGDTYTGSKTRVDRQEFRLQILCVKKERGVEREELLSEISWFTRTQVIRKSQGATKPDMVFANVTLVIDW